MKILLTGGSGDVGTLLAADMLALGHEVVNIDVAPPKIAGARFVQGSITDRAAVAEAMQGVNCVVHIAAWHGIHEGVKTPAEFHDLNVTGTFNTLQAAADAGVKKFIFISSTSVDDKNGLYGNTKIVGEEMVRAHAARHPETTYITLRPRAFVPSWNKAVYKNFTAWAKWFMKGAVHIDDVKSAILIALEHAPAHPAPVYVIDGAYDYTAQDLKDWNADTFLKHYAQYEDVARQYGLDTARKPKVLDIAPENKLQGYAPAYSLKNLLQDLRAYGEKGPPAPFDAQPRRADVPPPPPSF